MKRLLLLLILFSSYVAANDQSEDIEQLIASFTRCDASFFNELVKHREKLEQYTIINPINSEQAYIPVADRGQNGKNLQLFTKPIHYKSLSIIGYYDSALTLDKYGDYYFRGFIIDNTPLEIKTALDSLSWQEMEIDSLYIASSKIRYLDDSLDIWHENTNTMSGVKTMPAQGTAEKLLLLENSPEMTLLVCSIQGFFPPELLVLARPDLNEH